MAMLVIARQSASFDPGPSPLLMRHPTVSKTSIVFQYAGDLWRVPREGGDAVRLTSAGKISDPYFSPDGTEIAFTGHYDGNTDVFVMPATGGVPKRLTAHPDADEAVGWTPDGKSILFRSSMLSNTDHPRLFTVSKDGGLPQPLPLPSGVQGCYSPDGKQIAYVAHGLWERAWKRYRGGQTTTIWIADLATSHVHGIPRKNTMDEDPIWMGDSIYYLNDKDGPVGLNRYDTKTGQVSTCIQGAGFDLKSASGGPDCIAIEKLGSLWLFNPATKELKPVPVTIRGDFPEVRTELKDVSRNIQSVKLSPSGQRVLISARGWVFTVPVKKGSTRLLDGPQGVFRRDPAWSPDGKSIAYVTDQADGQEKLAIRDLATGTDKFVPLGDPPASYKGLLWSPDSKKIAYNDNRLHIWVLDLTTGKNTIIDSGTYRGDTNLSPHWSPDSEWLTWSRDLDTHVDAVFIEKLGTNKPVQVTDGFAEATSPVFSSDGKHLFFLGSTDTGLAVDFEDLSRLNAANSTENVFALVLRKNLPNPLQPESDEETAKEEKKPEAAKKEPEKFDIDLDHLEHRIIVLPLPTQHYSDLTAGPGGSLFVLSYPPRVSAIAPGSPGTVHKFSFEDRKVSTFATGISGVGMSADASKILLSAGGQFRVVSAAGSTDPGDGKVDLSELKVKIDPLAEWKAMYHEVWEGERLLLYDPHMHGLDSYAIEKRYAPFLSNIVTRDDLNYLFTDMLGEICIGHMFISGGDIPRSSNVPGGLLGCDFTIENGHYRLSHVYDGERWNPDLYAPLAQPGVDAQVGEYLLEVDGKPLLSSTDIYETLEGKAGIQVKLKIGPNADGTGARIATVLPVGSEFALRFRDWTESNRRTVERETDGRIGYLHVPDTDSGGWREFNRFYYVQANREGVIVDDRFNHGGLINDWMVREMEKPLDFGSMTRYGKDWKIPSAAVYGPKVMLINEMAGSGGDIFPFLFHQHGVGKLVGKRTWGAMLSAYGFSLVDGGTIRAPDDAMYNPVTGAWIIENEGTPPDIDVELDPYLWRQGVDAQLEAGIAEIKRNLATYKAVPIKRPSYPDKTKLPGHK
jgi:tricorn protease